MCVTCRVWSGEALGQGPPTRAVAGAATHPVRLRPEDRGRLECARMCVCDSVLCVCGAPCVHVLLFCVCGAPCVHVLLLWCEVSHW